MGPKSTRLLQSRELIMLNFSTPRHGLWYVAALCHVIFCLLEENDVDLKEGLAIWGFWVFGMVFLSFRNNWVVDFVEGSSDRKKCLLFQKIKPKAWKASFLQSGWVIRSGAILFAENSSSSGSLSTSLEGLRCSWWVALSMHVSVCVCVCIYVDVLVCAVSRSLYELSCTNFLETRLLGLTPHWESYFWISCLCSYSVLFFVSIELLWESTRISLNGWKSSIGRTNRTVENSFFKCHLHNHLWHYTGPQVFLGHWLKQIEFLFLDWL